MPWKIADMTAQDTGGQSYRLARAITDYTPHTSRSFRRSPDYLGFPVDIAKEGITKASRQEYVRDYLATADIIHVHNMYRYANGWAPLNPDARWLMHQHGRIPTAQKKAFLAADETRGARRVVSTINLLRYVGNDPEFWIPAPLRLSEYDALPREKHEGFRVAHSPTNRNYKGTELFLMAIHELTAEGVPVEAVLIENTPHEECLKIKASCDAVYDQMHLCFGNSALEGMAMGLPALVGMAPDTHKMVEHIIGYRPYVTATPDTLKDRIRLLATDTNFYIEASLLGRKYVEDFHDDKLVAQKVTRHYEVLMDG